MGAKKEVYLLVKELVNSNIEIKHWDIWNDNVERDGEVDSFPTPAVFFEWSSGVWEPSIEGSVGNLDDKRPNQNGNLEFTLHIVIKKSQTEEKDELYHFDIEDLVYNSVHFKGITDADNDFIEGKIQRVSEDTVLRHKVWRDKPVTYSVKVLECGTSSVEDGGLQDAQPVVFDVVPELTISNKAGQNTGSLTINISE